MAKFLNETGLSHFWSKVKEFLKSKYVAINDAITIKSKLCISELNNQGLTITNNDTNSLTELNADGGLIIQTFTDSSQDNIKEVSMVSSNGVSSYDTVNNIGSAINKNGIVVTNDIENVNEDLLKNDGFAATNSTIQVKEGQDKVSISKNGAYFNSELGNSSNISPDGVRITEGSNRTSVTATLIETKSFIKTGGTNLQVLLADGSIATLNAANGIPKLDANGRIPLSQLANLDTTLFQVVTSLPTSGIKSNRIYLLKSSATGTQNIYGEYIYTGNVSATYDASKWEKLGEYKANIDLTPYSKKTETVNGVTAGTSTATNAVIKVAKADSTSSNVNIPAATQTAAGVMQASDKKALDTLTARYPLSIASFTASPSLVEVGVAADITYAWTLNNTDFHPITAQGIVVDGAASVAVDKATNTYKKTGLAGATTATTKKATLTVNNSLTKDVNITYHYPSYIGVVTQGYVPSEENLKKLTKSIEWGKGKTVTLTTNNQIAIYAYPASYGDLTSIKDGNGFEGFAGYTKSTVTFANKVVYNVYTQKLPATASSKYTFA